MVEVDSNKIYYAHNPGSLIRHKERDEKVQTTGWDNGFKHLLTSYQSYSLSISESSGIFMEFNYLSKRSKSSSFYYKISWSEKSRYMTFYTDYLTRTILI